MKCSGFWVIIPARYGSSRLPGKPLSEIHGLPMVVQVAMRAQKVKGASEVVVATDDDRILDVVKDFGFKGLMTSSRHRSGTDRIAEAVDILGLSDKDVIVNIQGDQPLFPIHAVEMMVQRLESDKGLAMTTVACPMDEHSAQNPNRVKVVIDESGRALYFSRAVIPFDRDGVLRDEATPFFHHIGLYCYRVDFLRSYVRWPQGRLEAIECLEQLRVLERGFKIGVCIVDKATPEVDTDKDLEYVRALMDKDHQEVA